MAHELAKLLLEQAGTFLSRKEALKTALDLGMPLEEARDYLDWLEMVREQSSPDVEGDADHDQLSSDESR